MLDNNDQDPYLWLEEIEGERALDWVKSHNQQTLDRYEKSELFQSIYQRTLETLNSDEKLVYPSMTGDTVYNFWRDAKNERGLLRRTGLEAFKSGDYEWETVLSVDQLAADEEENWVYKGHQVLSPDYQRTLVWLSRGGSDAAVVREFDLRSKSFIPDGFQLPEAKSELAWKDQDNLYVGTDFGEGSMTNSGYPRILKVWRRGTPLEEAKTLFEVSREDLAVGVWAVRRLDESHDFVTRAIDFWNDQKFLLDDGQLQELDLPSDAPIQAVFRGQLLVALRSDWTRLEGTFVQGSVLSLNLADLAAGIEQHATVVFDPQSGGTVESVSAIANHLILTVTRDVKTELLRYSYGETGWSFVPVQLGQGGSTTPASISRARDDFFLTHEDFLSPTALHYSEAGGEIVHIQSLPERFATDGLHADQFWAVSKDGTRVPYYVIKRLDLVFDGTAPTLLYGYGGFEVSLLPSYMSLAGPAWLERGGVYVSANIRGGGEFGPGWHQAALRENRHKAFEDFEAVAEDLIRRKITSAQYLGVHGRSNGGLLTGAMLTRRPDLFGAVLIGVPLLDMKRYNKLLAGASWMAEYGDPDKPEDWAFIQTYSPYHNIDPKGRYPVPLIFTSTKDDRVHPGHARKMAARLEEYGFPVIYYENLEGGHAGASNNPQTAFFTALNYAYLWDLLSDTTV